VSQYHRVNLCFNLDDPKQVSAYKYLSAAGREKSALVVQLVLKHMAEEQRKSDVQMNLFARIESIVQTATAAQTDTLHAEIKEVLEEVKKRSLVAPTSSEPIQAQIEKTEEADEMSDEAFAAMMAFGL
jgi:hypothetical protein